MLASLAAADITSDARFTPFGNAGRRWAGDGPEALRRQIAQYLWRKRAEWTPQRWFWPFAVVIADSDSAQVSSGSHGQVVGMQALFAADFNVLRSVESDSWIGAGFQGRGLGTAARSAALCFAFRALRACEAVSEYADGNEASRRVSQKLGYEPDGTRPWIERGSATRLHRMTLSRETFHDRGSVFPVTIDGFDEPCCAMLGIGQPTLLTPPVN